MSSTPVAPRRIALMLETDGPGGAETMLIQLAEELRRRGHHVLAVHPYKGFGWLSAQMRERGFATDVFRLSRPLDLGCLNGMVEMLGRHRIEVVHSHEFTMAIYGAAAARRLGIPHVITMHGSQTVFTKWRRRAALRLAFALSRNTVAVSKATHRYMTEVMAARPDQYLTIPNGVHFVPGNREAARAALGLRDSDVLVVAVGNLTTRKGHIFLLRALAGLGDMPWHVAIAGRGDQEEALRAFAREHNIEHRVHLLGLRNDIPDVLAASDIYTMPSLWEGLPMAMLEAMFARRAIVASLTEGIPEAITHGVEGLLATPGDEEALRRELERVIGDASLREQLASAALARAEREFSAAVMTDAYERAYGIRAGRAGKAG